MLTQELRKVMTSAALAASHCQGVGDKSAALGNMLTVFNFAAFGGNCGLITADEVADWKAVSQWRKDLPEVMERWNGRQVCKQAAALSGR